MQRVAPAGRADFWPVSKFNGCSLPLRGTLSVKRSWYTQGSVTEGQLIVAYVGTAKAYVCVCVRKLAYRDQLAVWLCETHI